MSKQGEETERLENYKFSTRDEYLVALDSVMPPNNYKVNDQVTYLPIEIQEALADVLFHYWNVIDEKYNNILNEIICTVKIEYMPNYPGADIHTCTGSAAHPITMLKGSKVAEFGEKKISNALGMALPASRSKAIGCALNSLGNIFGRNLGRKNLSIDFKLRQINNVENKI